MLKKIGIDEKPYFEPEDLIQDVIVPCFREARKISMLTAYFNFDSFLEIAESLEEFLTNDGKMRIIVSIPKYFDRFEYETLDQSVIQAYSSKVPTDVYENFKKTILTKSGRLKDELQKNKIALIAYLVKSGMLEIKFSIRDSGFDHSKIYIFDDTLDKVVLSGSMNWTFNGLNEQSNQTSVSTSFSGSDNWIHYLNRFEDIWENRAENINSFVLDEVLADELLEMVGKPDYSNVRKFFEERTVNSLYYDVKTSPLYFEFNLGNSALLPHQVHGVNKSLESWPIRHLFADEVGLGKTLEVGATIAYLSIFHEIDRQIIFAPQAVIKQWQSEMKIHFGLDFFILSKNKNSWVDISGIEIERENDSYTYGENYPDKVILSKDLARGSLNNHIFSNSNIYPDLVVLDEAHHARGSKKTKTFKETLLRKMIGDIKEEVQHIVFATATPMRTHPDEYYYLLELLGLNRYLSEIDYKILLTSLSNNIDDWSVEELVPAVEQLTNLKKNIQSFSKSMFNENEIKLLETLEEFNNNPQKLEQFKGTIYSIILKFNPLTLFTSRSSRDVLERYPDTYKFPKRIFKTSPITTENIYLEFEKFFEQIMEYTDSNYLESEKIMGVKIQNTAFAKAGFKESFVSSFWSARQRLLNRKKTLDGYIDAFENDRHREVLLEKKLIEEIGVDDDIEDADSISFNLQNFNKGNVLNSCKQELSAVEDLIEFSEYLIDNHKQPDPKISQLLILIKSIIEEPKPTLIFAHYIATLDSAYKAIVTDFADKITGIGMFKGTEIWYEIDGVRYPSDKFQIKELLESGEITILLCSEAASEGINLQSADKLINLDVPWVPSVLEQRIGRIARLGQESDEVRIFNLWYPNSYEAKIYTALIQRVDLLSLAMGHFPQIVSNKIKSQVEDLDETVSSLINELNTKKAEDEFIGLSQLWDYDKENHDTYGNYFRKSMLEMLENFGFNIDKYTYKAGEKNVFTLRSNILKNLIENLSMKNAGTYTISKILYEKKLYGFVLKKASEDYHHLVSPRDLDKIFEGLFSGQKVKINIISKIEQLSNFELQDLVTIYKDNLVEWFLPNHSNFLKYFDKKYINSGRVSIEKISTIDADVIL
ncbi:helicase-related protein [Acidimicrobiia bacterium]|nr:helicase-related protein [Acidimicrobiia bacterium]